MVPGAGRARPVGSQGASNLAIPAQGPRGRDDRTRPTWSYYAGAAEPAILGAATALADTVLGAAMHASTPPQQSAKAMASRPRRLHQRRPDRREDASVRDLRRFAHAAPGH